jgi:eukaryotic-like serine/threonine-protein kinase
MEARRFGRFTVLAELGSGGMGRAYRAHDPVLQREVCIKVLREDLASASANLLAEARSASALNHPNICTVFDVGDVDGTPFIAMELVDGRPLSDLIVPGGLPIETTLRYATQIASALSHAHQHAVVHGDLKGHNVLVTPAGSVKLLDFGLARKLQSTGPESLTRLGEGGGEISGTLPFMAPETIRGAPLTPAADVWALGVLLTEMVSGARPFTGENAFDLASAIISNPPRPLPSSVPPALAAVIARCLQKEPAHRYANGREALVALEPLHGGTIQTTPPRPESLSTRLQRYRALLVIAVIAVIAVAVAANFTYRWVASKIAVPGHNADKKLTLVVLPFDNLSRNKDEDYFADGITDALITDLSRIPNVSVISRYSAMRYKASGKSSREIGQELGVQVIADGTVLRSEGQVRISVRLVDAATDRILWARNYVREVKDVLVLQSAVVRAMAGEMRASFVPADEERLTNAAPIDPGAHEEYLRGRHHWNRRTAQGLQQSIVHYKRALELAPNYAPAYAGLAQSYVLLPAFPLGVVSPAQGFPQAVEAAEHAIALDDRLADAHAALGYVRLHSLDFAGSEQSFRRALDINPNDATTRFWFAAALGAWGRSEEATDQVKQAAALDPVSPIIASGVAWIQHLARRFDREVDAARSALQLEPNFMMARYRLGVGQLHQEQFDDGIAELEKAYRLSGEIPDLLAVVAYAYGRAGKRAEALARLHKLKDLSRSRYVSPYALGLAHTGLGDRGEAVAWLRRAVDEHAWGAAFLAVDPDFDPLRGDAAFEALVGRVRK